MIWCAAGFGAPWHLTDIVVEEVKTKRKFIFKCNRWLSLSDEDRKLVRELKAETPPGQPPRQQRRFGEDDYYGGRGDDRNGPPRDRLAATDPYARDRLGPQERDRFGQTEPYGRERDRLSATAEPDRSRESRAASAGFGPSPDAMTELKLEFYSSSTREGSMRHNVWLQFEGERGTSKNYLIANSDANRIFVAGEVDRMSIKSKSLGRLLAVRLQGVQREGAELDPSRTQWDLSKMTVYDTLAGQRCASPRRPAAHLLSHLSFTRFTSEFMYSIYEYILCLKDTSWSPGSASASCPNTTTG